MAVGPRAASGQAPGGAWAGPGRALGSGQIHVPRGMSEWAGNKPCEKLGEKPGGKLGEKLGGFVGGFVNAIPLRRDSRTKSTTKIHWKIHLGNQGRISLTNPTNEMAYNSIPGVGLQPKPGARARSLPRPRPGSALDPPGAHGPSKSKLGHASRLELNPQNQ